MALGDLAKAARLLGDALLGAVELDQEQRLLRQGSMRISVEGAHRQRVDELDAGNRQARLDGLDRRLASRAYAGKRAMPRGDCLGDAGELKRHLDDDAERALGADEHMSEIVARRRLLSPRSRTQERSVGSDHPKRQHHVLHGAVAHRIGAGGAGGGHAAERSVGARIDREKEPAVAQVLVELLPCDAGLGHAIEIVDGGRENVVHWREVERDAAVGRIDMAFERRADSERNDGGVMASAELDQIDDVLFVFGEDDGVRRLVLEPGERVPMRWTDLLGSGEAVAKTGGEIGIEGGDRVARETALALADGELGHWVSLLLEA